MEKRQPRAILAENLTRIMEHKQLSQHGLKRLSGLPQVTIGRIVNAASAAQVDTLEPLARALGFEPWMLLYPDLDPEDAPSVGGQGKMKFSFSPATMERLLRLFDSLTAAQQEDTLKNMADLVGTNKDLVRELTKRATFAKALEIPERKPPPRLGEPGVRRRRR